MKLWEQWGQELVLFDGAMGTMLQKAGLPKGTLPECWNLEKPEVVREIHASYLAAGCQVIKTNTFGANQIKISQTRYTVEQIITRGVELAKEAVNACGHTAYVAMDIGPTGKLLAPLGDLEFEEACGLFSQMASAGEKAGADLILIETMSDTYEMKAAVVGAKEASALPVVATMIFDERGKLLTGGDIRTVVTLLEGLGVDALGINCGIGPHQMKGLLEELLRCSSLPIVLNPNAGLPHCIDGNTTFDVTPQEFANTMRELAEMGAWAIGGCCGTSPDHLREMVCLCRNIHPRPLERKKPTVVSSYSRSLLLGDDTVTIGNLLPDHNIRIRQALEERNMDLVIEEALDQHAEGAEILLIDCIGGMDEAGCLEREVKELQSVTNLPLGIRAGNLAALEASLRIYNGKALILLETLPVQDIPGAAALIGKYGGVIAGHHLSAEAREQLLILCSDTLEIWDGILF